VPAAAAAGQAVIASANFPWHKFSKSQCPKYTYHIK
jgi:hypothetical protein